MTKQQPAWLTPQRGRPKRLPRDQHVHVLTLRVPEELSAAWTPTPPRCRPPSPTCEAKENNLLRLRHFDNALNDLLKHFLRNRCHAQLPCGL